MLVLAISILFISFISQETAISDAGKDLRVGLGYLNGTAGETANIPYEEVNIRDVLNEFTPFGSLSVETQVNETGSPVSITVTNNEATGPVTLLRGDFPIFGISQTSNWELFYKQVEGVEDTILVAAVDSLLYSKIGSSGQFVSDLAVFSPLIFSLALLFGWFVSQRTVTPIQRIARAAEKISGDDLSQRVPVVSDDEFGSLSRCFNNMAERLESSFEAQKRFVSDAAHELKTPLASVKTSVTQALGEDREAEEYRKLLRFLSQRIDKLESLINDLLLLASSDEGAAGDSDGSADISEVIADAEEAFRYLFDERGINFRVRANSKLNVRGRRQHLLRCITNLLDNAAKNTPRGGLVSISASRNGSKAIVSISDTGPGIPPEHTEKVFERFYKLPGSQKGFGLGLSICRSIVAGSGGQITLDSTPGQGSVFTITLPLAGTKK